ncbi:hypothetical protein, partial [Kingella kingae]
MGKNAMGTLKPKEKPN